MRVKLVTTLFIALTGTLLQALTPNNQPATGAVTATSFSSLFKEKAANEKSKADFSMASSQRFIENKGQVFGYDGLPHAEVKFVFQQGATQIFLLEKGIAYQFTKTHYPEGYLDLLTNKTLPGNMEKIQAMRKKINTETYRMDMTLAQASSHALITSEGMSEDPIHYYTHNVLNVHQYAKVTYHNIYPGIDWVIYTSNGQVKYDFVVRPGADPSVIKLSFKHQEGLSLNKDGSFTLKNRMGSITEKKPVSAQNDTDIKTAFSLTNNTLSFVLDHYNTAQNLIIDPAIIWATYYGGSGNESGNACITDASGNVYLAGTTLSAAGIASGGHQMTYGGTGSSNGIGDAFLVKFNSAGVRQWATYYGGTGGDDGNSCAVDAAGNVYLGGQTSSSANIASGGHQNTYMGTTAPTTNAGGDAFLVKFNSSGVRQWATYYGDAGQEFGNSCAVDASGNVYLSGVSSSSVNIASGGHQNTYMSQNTPLWGNAFLVKFNGSGVRQWATYYGGTGFEELGLCNTDAAGNVYLYGVTISGSNIASGGFQNTLANSFDAFLVKFNSAGVRQWGTYYGDSGTDGAQSCAFDAAGNIYLAGSTTSSVGIASAGHQSTYGGGGYDAFLVKFSSSGSRLWSTYYGGSGFDLGNACVTDSNGDVYLTGRSASSSGIAAGGYQNTIGGSDDAFVVKFNSSGVRQWGTYYGGTGADYGNWCTMDASDNLYLAGTAASAAGIATGGYQNTTGGGNDAFLAKFCSSGPVQPGAISGNTLVCMAGSASYSVAAVSGATSYSWTFPGTGWSGTSATNSISATTGSGGVISVTAINSCGASVAQTLTVSLSPPPVISVNSGSICSGQVFTLVPSGAVTYTISGGSATVNPTITTSYSVTGTSTAGCASTLATIATVSVDPLPFIPVGSATICSGQSFTLTPIGAGTFTYSGGSSVVSPTVTTTYSITGTSPAGCVSTVAVVFTITVDNTFTLPVNSGTICSGQSFTLTPGAGSYTYSGGSAIVNPTVTTSYSVTGVTTGSCANTASFTVYVDNCTGLTTPADNTPAFSVYPNPNTGLFTIASATFENISWAMYNLLGEKISEASAVSNKEQVDISHLPADIYILVFRQKNKAIHTLKITKE